jgi:hypothetical protein
LNCRENAPGNGCFTIRKNGYVSFSLTNIPFTLPSDHSLFGPEYIRYPMQPGDKGIVIPADAYIGMSGGWRDRRSDAAAKLSALTYLPISNTEWRTSTAKC